MIKGYCIKHQNNECLVIVAMYHVFNKFLKKNQNFPQKLGYFHFSESSSTFVAASWLSIFVSNESSLTLLSIDRSECRFESHAGG